MWIFGLAHISIGKLKKLLRTKSLESIWITDSLHIERKQISIPPKLHRCNSSPSYPQPREVHQAQFVSPTLIYISSVNIRDAPSCCTSLAYNIPLYIHTSPSFYRCSCSSRGRQRRRRGSFFPSRLQFAVFRRRTRPKVLQCRNCAIFLRAQVNFNIQRL